MNVKGRKSADEAKKLLMYYFGRTNWRDNGEIRSIVDLIIEAAVEEVIDRLGDSLDKVVDSEDPPTEG